MATIGDEGVKAPEGVKPEGDAAPEGTILDAPKDDAAPKDDGTVLDAPKDDAAPKDDEPKDKKPDGPPEKYEDFKLPEGLEFDAEQVTQFKGVAKDLGLTQEQAQKLVDFDVARAKSLTEESQRAFVEMKDGWLATAKGDKEIGGTGFEQSTALARQALDAFGSPGLRDALTASGLGNHPEVIRAFAKIGKAISEDTLHFGKGEEAPAPKSHAERIFGTTQA